MLVSRAVAIACLTVFAWLLWALAALLAVYFLMSWRSGDPTFKVVYLALAGIAALGGGFFCRHLARRIEGA